MLANWLGYAWANGETGSLPIYTLNCTIPPSSAAILLLALVIALAWSVAGRTLDRRRRNDALLRKAYIDLLTDFPWPVCAFDSQGLVAFWNRECERISGIQSNELVANAQLTAEVFPAKKHPASWNTVENVFVLGRCSAQRTVRWRKLVVSQGNWPTWLVGQDLTAESYAGCNVLTERRLRSLFSAANLNVRLIDRQQQVHFEHTTEPGGPTADSGDASRIQEVFDSGQALSLRREQAERIAEIELLPLWEDNGRLDYVAEVGRDVTEKQLAERERRLLERHQRHDQKLEALATLAGGMAHDFNNIMATISGYAEIIGYGQDPHSQIGQYAAAINQAAQRAKDLVRRVLLFSRNGGAEPRAVAVAPILMETVNGLRAELTAATTLELDLDAGDAMVWAEPYQLHLLIKSLCENAIQATSAGMVKIEAAICQQTEVDVPGRCVRLRVSDSGVGMDQATLVRIFEPFFTTKDMGRGLGLATAQGIVNALGGEIAVRSQLGHGSVFTVYLPTVERPAASGSPLAPLAGAGQAVLIFDPQIDVLEESCAWLRAWGYSVTASSDQLDLLELLGARSRPWSLVLADPGLPQDGAEDLTRRLVALCAETPLVLMSYYVDSFDPFFLKNLDIELVLEKPLDQDKLTTAIRFAIPARCV